MQGQEPRVVVLIDLGLVPQIGERPARQIYAVRKKAARSDGCERVWVNGVT